MSANDQIIWRTGPELTAAELHALLRLRVDVFVVEQECAYPEIDGRDLEPTTTHAWLTNDSGITASLRMLFNHEPTQIGRVVTAPNIRGQGFAERLLHAAHDRAEGTSFLEAQSYLVDWYQRLGWQVAGEEFVEDGIPHTPMIRS